MQRIKYPKTFHLPWSESLQNDDRMIQDISVFENKEIVITEKLDGEGTSFSNQYIHARSLDSVDHESRHWVKGLWGQIKHLIPENMIICGENVYAVHSVVYDSLETYFYVYNIWLQDTCLSFEETIEYCDLLGLKHVPILHRGIYNEKELIDFHKTLDLEKQEGYVIRITDSFERNDFHKSVAKWVRKNHVQPNEGHWMTKKVIPNKLKVENNER